MIEDMGWKEEGQMVKRAVEEVIREGKWVTKDLGGNSSTKEFEKAVLGRMQ